jgi:NAD(P)-dependent dehydrogenase (short-subunit alcohol dehydrogenase family)
MPPMGPQDGLFDRVVIVTGGVRGLGREMALELLELGARVVVTGAGPSEALRAMQQLPQALGPLPRLRVFEADVTNFDACQQVLNDTLASFGDLHVLINNAGRGMRVISETFNTTPVPFWEVDPAHWRSIVDCNLNGAFNMARVCVPHMLARGFGKLINISTSDQTMVRRGYSPYGPSKAALEAASRAWSQDLAGHGVDVNVYLPGGATDTDLLPPGPGKKGADGNLLPADIMRRGMRWLCSDASNGHTGGRYIARMWDPALPAAEAAMQARAPGFFDLSG